jgi:hypothetical protein
VISLEQSLYLNVPPGANGAALDVLKHARAVVTAIPEWAQTAQEAKVECEALLNEAMPFAEKTGSELALSAKTGL